MVKSVHHPHKSVTPDVIELTREAQDHHSGLFYLVGSQFKTVQYKGTNIPSLSPQPNPDGVHCLVLAGCLMANQPHRPGKTQPIPRLRRLPVRS